MPQKLLWVVLIVVGFILAHPLVSPVLAQDISPTSAVVEIQKTASLPWYVGAILFVGVAVGLTLYKNRLASFRKKPTITPSTCAPLVEEGTRPFQPLDDIPD